MINFSEKIDIIRNEPETAQEAVSSKTRLAYEPAVKVYAKLRGTVDKPPEFDQESPFRNPATRLLKHAQSLLLPSNTYTATMQSLGVNILFELKEAVDESATTLKRYSGGSSAKNKSWKDGLAEDCGKDVLKERFQSCLSKCKGEQLKLDKKHLEAAMEAASVHITVMEKLDRKLADAEAGSCRESLANALLELCRARATKFEYWVCATFFGSKEPLDKRDITLRYGTEFDAPPVIEGGRESWIHDGVIAMEKEMLSIGFSTVGGHPAQKKQK